MKKNLLLISLTVCSFIFGQEEKKSIYFPQEQIVLASCSNASNPNECISTYFQELVSAKLNEKKSLKLISKQKKDTVYAGAKLVYNPDKTINIEKSSCGVSGKNLRRKLGDEIDAIFLTPVIKEITNQKAPQVSYHCFNYKYLIQRNGKKVTLLYIPDDEKYTGGIIEEFPVFPGCENLSSLETRKCFNRQMQAHIAENFSYPKQAEKNKIKGKVSIIFKINKEGNISDIKSTGPHKILEDEAERILKLLPNCKPGLCNGEPIKVPFAIPITFKLE